MRSSPSELRLLSMNHCTMSYRTFKVSKRYWDDEYMRRMALIRRDREDEVAYLELYNTQRLLFRKSFKELMDESTILGIWQNVRFISCVWERNIPICHEQKRGY